MKLTKHESEVLKAFKKSEAFKILCKIEEEASIAIGKQLADPKNDLTDPTVIKNMQMNQIYTKSRRDFLLNTESHTKGVYSPK